MTVGICVHSVTIVLVESDTDVEVRMSGVQTVFQFIPKVSECLYCVFMKLKSFVHRVIVMLKQCFGFVSFSKGIL